MESPGEKRLIEKIRNLVDHVDVCTATTGKRETVTYKIPNIGKPYLLKIMKNFYQSFKREVYFNRLAVRLAYAS